MSEKTWPNWNAMSTPIIHSLIFIYPCLRRRGPIETNGIQPTLFVHQSYPFLRRSGPIETWIYLCPSEGYTTIHICEDVAQLKRCGNFVAICPRSCLSMSAKTWPNWNAAIDIATLVILLSYPCLKRRGPIETAKPWPRRYSPCGPIHVWEDVAQLPCPWSAMAGLCRELNYECSMGALGPEIYYRMIAH